MVVKRSPVDRTLEQIGLEWVRTVKEEDGHGRALHRVKDRDLELHYALKSLPLEHDAQLRQVRSEVVAINRLPFGVAPHCHRFWQRENRAFLLLDWVEGRSLAEAFPGEVRDADDARRRLRAAALLAQALDRVHRESVLHRDIKPENAIAVMSPKREVDSVVLVDFGLSGQRRVFEEGTLSFHAPEQFADRSMNLCRATDIFGLAQTTWTLLVGRPRPLRPDKSLTDWEPSDRPGVPGFVGRDVLELLERATRYDARERLDSAAEFASTLKRYGMQYAPPRRR
jgi:serine/threonine-protein kinase